MREGKRVLALRFASGRWGIGDGSHRNNPRGREGGGAEEGREDESRTIPAFTRVLFACHTLR